MSAREDLIWRCTQAGLSEEWATRQVDNFAHELAEKIRGANPDRSPDWSDGTDWAADLIDPRV